MTQQYVYGALNRLEEAVNGAGKAAKYQYNGLGHRVGKAEGRLPADQTGKLDPQSRIDREIGNLTQIHYTIDLTREYHNLLEKTEGEKRQTYFWDGNVASYEENGRQSYYLQDELGSPLRIEDQSGTIQESYGYGAFGEDLYGNQGEMQPFGYTGYQKDKVAGTYFAQAREYQADAGRFVGRDIIKGQASYPLTINEYIYCGNMPFYFYDPNGLFWHVVCGAVVGAVANAAITIGTGIVTGDMPDPKSIFASAAGGAVTGMITAAFGPGASTAASVVGGSVERILDGALHGDSAGEIAKDVVVGAGADLMMNKIGKVLKNSPQVKTVSEYLESTRIGKKIKVSNTRYKQQISRGRNSWNWGKGKAIHMRYNTYRNGVIGETGTALKKKISMAFQDVAPGVDIKAELKNMLGGVYDAGMKWVQHQYLCLQVLDRILKDVTNEELEEVLCIE